jgi:hypothetical protein
LVIKINLLYRVVKDATNVSTKRTQNHAPLRAINAPVETPALTAEAFKILPPVPT